jgi:hypothetical protein
VLVKVQLSEYLQNLLGEVAKLIYTTPKAALERLLVQVELYARNGKLDLGFEWTEAMLKLSGRTSAPGAAAYSMQETIDFDVALLETSAKCKGGYAGVYLVNGSKFRAIVPNPKGGTCFLGSRPQALDAAIDRYHWYKEHGLPYGHLAQHIDDLRKRHPDLSIEQCLDRAASFARDTLLKDMKWPFTFDQAANTLTAFRKARGLAEGSNEEPDEDPEAKARAAEALRKSAELFGDDDDGTS